MHVVLLAHGSRDPRHREVMESIVDAVAAALPPEGSTGHASVSVAYLDHAPPALPAAIARSGEQNVVVVVPLLLTDAFHARVDVPAAVEQARHTAADVRVVLTAGVGDARLTGALRRRAADTGVDLADTGTAAILLAAGSSDAGARAQVAEVADDWLTPPLHGTHAFIAGEGPTVAEAVAELAAAGARRIVVTPYLLAPGVLPDRGAAAARAPAEAAGIEVVVAEPIGAAPELVTVIVERIASAPS